MLLPHNQNEFQKTKKIPVFVNYFKIPFSKEYSSTFCFFLFLTPVYEKNFIKHMLRFEVFWIKKTLFYQ